MSENLGQKESTHARPATLFDLHGFSDLRSFTGTENYWSSIFAYQGRCLTYTDGVKYVAKNAGAYWLIDVVFSHVVAIYKRTGADMFHNLLVAKLEVNDDDNTAMFTLSDGDGHALATQKIEFTDFPALTQTIWVKEGIAMLPSEY